MPKGAGRPSRKDEVSEVCRLAQARPESVKNFFHRPGRLSPEMRQRIATAVAKTGYRPVRKISGALAGVAVGYQLPRSWTHSSTVMNTQFKQLVHSCQEAGAQLLPFVVDPAVSGVNDVVGGTEFERSTPTLGLLGWQREYANNLAVSVYRDMMRYNDVQAFVINDLFVDDPRLDALRSEGVPYVALGLPRSSSHTAYQHEHPYVETDNRSAIVKMVRSLRAVGCNSFGHVAFADDGSHVVLDRRDAVTHAVGHEVPTHAVSYYDSLKPQDVNCQRAVAEWLGRNDVDAVICDSDALAYIVHLAARIAGRSVRQDPPSLRSPTERTLMLTGNDNSTERTLVAPEDRWMTMQAPEAEKMKAAIRLLAEQRAGATPESILIEPQIVRWCAESSSNS